MNIWSKTGKIKILALIRNKISKNVSIRKDAKNVEFPSIWLELTATNKKPIVIAGFYRQWSSKGDKSEKMQIKQVKDFAIQIESIAKKCNRVIITGDANLCSLKWNDEKYIKENIAIHIKNAIEQCGLTNQPIGNTYMHRVSFCIRYH